MGKKKKRGAKTVPAPAPIAPADRMRMFSPFFVAVMMFALAFILYGRTIGYSFACDDRAAIFDNRFTVKGVSGIPGILSHDLFYGIFGEQVDCLQGGRYRPLSLVTFALETQIFGVTPGVYHFTNILLYGLTGFLLFWVLRRLFRGVNGKARAPYPARRLAPLHGAPPPYRGYREYQEPRRGTRAAVFAYRLCLQPAVLRTETEH